MAPDPGAAPDLQEPSRAVTASAPTIGELLTPAAQGTPGHVRTGPSRATAIPVLSQPGGTPSLDGLPGGSIPRLAVPAAGGRALLPAPRLAVPALVSSPLDGRPQAATTATGSPEGPAGAPAAAATHAAAPKAGNAGRTGSPRIPGAPAELASGTAAAAAGGAGVAAALAAAFFLLTPRFALWLRARTGLAWSASAPSPPERPG